MDAQCHHAAFEVGAKLLLSIHNLCQHGNRKFRDGFVGSLILTQKFGETAYRLDLSSCTAFYGINNIFHVSLLYYWWDNGVHAGMQPINVDEEAKYKVLGIKGHREQNAEV